MVKELKERSNEGITLIALVITIIVLLILAGVSITTLTGDNGIMKQSENAKENTQISNYQEQIELIIADEMVERKTTAKVEPLIQSLYNKITPSMIEGVTKTYVCDENNTEQSNLIDNKYIIVQTKEGYQLKIEVDNEKNVAHIIKSKQEEKEESVMITFEPNATDVQGSMEKQSVLKGKNANLLENKFTRDTYRFQEWNTKQDGTGEKYENGQEINITQNITLYAIWTPKDSKVYLYNNGEINSEIADIVQLQYTSKYPQGKFSKTQNTFSIEKVIVNGDSSTNTTDPWADLYVISQNEFDFSGYSKLCYSYSALDLRTGTPAGGTTNYRATIKLGVSQDNKGGAFDKYKQLISPDSKNGILTEPGIAEVDITDYNQTGYIKIAASTGSYQRQGANITIDKIWVEY